MPCRDYETSYNSPSYTETRLKEQCDRLARIACKAMTALEADGHADFLLLKDDEVREWWLQHKEADRKRMEEEARKKAERAEKKRLKKIKTELLERLTEDEKKALGL
jgi:AAA+ ATPase superfamily predicted ATPase